jgi:uncharacterized membrane protein YhaH (DUF805 family)
MIDWYLSVLRDNYANFSGRARRSEYWYFTLCQCIMYIAMILLGVAIGGDFEFVPFFLYLLATIIPYLAVLVRRLHDSGKSGWYFFVRLIPFVGTIWLLVLLCTNGDIGSNQYGYDPKHSYDDIDEIGAKEEY